MSALDFPEGSARRIVALARAHGWQRVRRNTLGWIVSGPFLWIAVRAPLDGAPWWGPPVLLAVVLLLPGVLAIDIVGHRIPEHLPYTARESGLAILLAETVTALGSLCLFQGLQTLGLAWIAVAHLSNPAVVMRQIAEAAHGLAVLSDVAASIVALLFVALAPSTLGGRSGLMVGSVRDVVVTCFVCAVWWLTGSAVAAVVASLAWFVVPDFGIDDSMSAEPTSTPLDDPGLVPILGPTAFRWNLARQLGWAGLAVVGLDLCIEVVLWWKPDGGVDRSYFQTFTGAVALWLLHVAPWGSHPRQRTTSWLWTGANDLPVYQRHLPVVPRRFVDGVWAPTLLHATVGVAALLAGQAVIGAASWRSTFLTVTCVFAIALLPAIWTWIRTALLVRRSALRYERMMLLVAFGLNGPIVVVVCLAWSEVASAIGPLAALVSFDAAVLLLALATWAWARRRWST